MNENLDFLPYFLVFIKRWRVIVFNLLFILVVSGLYAFLVASKEYKAEIVFLPPEGSGSSLSEIIGGNISLPSLSSSDLMPDQIPVLFSSKAYKKKIIERFNLYAHFNMTKNGNKLINTIKLLDKCLTLDADEIGGIGLKKTLSFSLCVYHTSKDTVYEMANYAFYLLDSAVRAVSIDRAHRDRVFVESQLEKSKAVLDSLQSSMKDFQLKNKAYDVPEQVKMTIRAVAELKAQLMLNDIRMQAIKREFSDETPEIAAFKKNNLAIEDKLRQLETRQAPDAVPSLQNTTTLLPEFVNQKRDLELQNQIILFLSKELEQAKIKEGKNISSLVVTDPALIPEYKSRPKRLGIMAVVTAIYMVMILSFILLQEVYRLRFRNSRIAVVMKETLRKK
jgi:tyrosine-protein kinase Etk/Wzc